MTKSTANTSQEPIVDPSGPSPAEENDIGPNEVGEFFDKHAENYIHVAATKASGMAPFHILTASEIERELHGRVGAIGGLWAQANRDRCQELHITIVDVSAKMLEPYAAAGFQTMVEDARKTSFENNSLDHVVLPLILHHITEGSWSASRKQIQLVLAEMKRILKPGGRIWISDFSVNKAVYAAERIASPIVKSLLGLAGIPLVIMHPESVYVKELHGLGFSEMSTFTPKPSSTSSLQLFTPVIGLDWLRIPFGLYPLSPVLISAAKPAHNR